MQYIHYERYVLFFCLLIISSCNYGDSMHDKNFYKNILDNVSEEKWNEMNQKRIYFGHQSVGFNIINGIKDIAKENEKIQLNITETFNLHDMSVPFFAHSKIGQNREPLSKIEAFDQIVRNGVGGKVDIAFFKLCYVDITETTDVATLFNNYKMTMDRLQKEYPETFFIHSTIPLRSVDMKWATLVKKLMGNNKRDDYKDNIKRNEFNAMVRQEYEHTGKLFDIAKAESIYPNGKEENFEKDKKRYSSLIPSYTDDGGHLNEKGRKIVAAHLLKLLIEFPN